MRHLNNKFPNDSIGRKQKYIKGNKKKQTKEMLDLTRPRFKDVNSHT